MVVKMKEATGLPRSGNQDGGPHIVPVISEAGPETNLYKLKTFMVAKLSYLILLTEASEIFLYSASS